MKNQNSRRDFIKKTAIGIGSFFIVPRHVLGGKGFTAPSDRLNIAGIGVGGKGWSDLQEVSKGGAANIVALCDVDDREAKNAFEKWDKAPRYRDFRKMLDAEAKNIDAVVVSTPDHTHATIAMASMELGKHVYLQKPLTHDIFEARQLTEAARKYKVVTQMGNQGGSSDGVRLMKEWYDAGIIGEVSRVEVWTNRPVWPQGVPNPTGKHEIPKEIDWNLWLGPAPIRDFNPAYIPFNWRGFWDFGTGGLGDMGCHLIDPPYRVLGLGYPSEVECSVSSVWEGKFKPTYYPDSCPAASIVHLKFPRKAGTTPLKLNWYDGGLLPERPESISPEVEIGDWNGGVMMIGDKGVMTCSCYGANPKLYPEALMDEAKKIPQTIARVPEGHYIQWVDAAKAGFGNKELSSSFDYAGPLTESILMGNLAIRSYYHQTPRPEKEKKWLQDSYYYGRKKLLWDGANMKITNFEAANQFVKREYRTY
jgi:predicted dehydrogenase